MLLVGSTYRGLYLFNTRKKIFSRLPGFDQPNNLSVFAIKKDEDGFWFTTDYHLCKWSASTHQTTTFNLAPAVMNASFTSPRFITFSDGRWATTTLAEVICFDPQGLTGDNRHFFDVAISRMNILDHPGIYRFRFAKPGSSDTSI
jgi:hypothetical protein